MNDMSLHPDPKGAPIGVKISINWLKDDDSSSVWAENFGRSLKGVREPTRGSKVFNAII